MTIIADLVASKGKLRKTLTLLGVKGLGRITANKRKGIQGMVEL